MSEIILPKDFIISRHAAQRFLQRIIKRDTYTAEDEDVAILLIQNILSNRALKTKRIDNHFVQLKYLNALFVYETDIKVVITVYPDVDNKEKVDWIYKFPAGLKFKGINSKNQTKLITEGFIPVRKDGRTLIGKKGCNIFQYDFKYNVIWQIKEGK
jgi:hypothetical protein